MHKPTIKLDYLGFWSNFDKNNNIFSKILSKHYNIEISSNPDFLITSYMNFAESPYEYTNYDCVRILISWDALYPDFNTFDYAITNFNVNCNDRHLWMPIGFVEQDRNNNVEIKHNNIDPEILNEKTEFCDFIYSRGNDLNNFRDKIFDELSLYKELYSVGTYKNNQNVGSVTMANKLTYQKKCKFSIAVEGLIEPGFISEKLMDSFAGQTVPIYFGHHDTIKNIFNKESFIDASEFNYDIKKIVDYVKYLDSNDEEYLSKLQAPALINQQYLENKMTELEGFLVHIFQQSKEDAYRRIRDYQPKSHELALNNYFHLRSKQKILFIISKMLKG